RADEPRRVARVDPADRRTAVGAAVEQAVDLPVLVAGDDDGTQTQAASDEVVRLRDLALVREVGPGAAEHPLHLPGEDIAVGVEAAVDALGPDELVERGHARALTKVTLP